MMRSLRARLLIGSFICAMAVFATAGVALYWLLRTAWIAEFDAALDAKAQALISLVEESGASVRIELEPGQMPEFQKSGHSGYFFIADDKGRVVAKSPSLAGVAWAVDARAAGDEPAHEFVSLPDGRDGRIARFSFQPRVEEDEHRGGRARARMVIAVARDATELRGMFLQLAWMLGGVFALAIVGSSAAMAWVVGRGLRPLSVLADRIHAIGAAGLSERVRLEQSPTEMRVVVERLNELLAKVEQGFARERSFTADVAHELRTPLAGLTTAMQVCLSQRRGVEEYEAVLGKCADAAGAMRSMVENLLTLARADADQLQPASESVDLSALLKEQWRAFEGRAAQRGLKLDWSLPAELRVQTDRGLLATVMRNLLDNAVSYSDAGGTVRIEGSSCDGLATVRIANTGSRVAPEDARRVFERFWRGDAARTFAGHCGLGLALCERIVKSLKGSIEARTALGEWFSVEVRLRAP